MTLNSRWRPLLTTIINHQTRHKSTSKLLSLNTPSKHLLPTCPQATCPCQAMPDLEIDYKKQLLNSTAPHSEHILIHTGTSDWPSRIDDELTKRVKESVRRISERRERGLPILVSSCSWRAERGDEVSLLGSGRRVVLGEEWSDDLFVNGMGSEGKEDKTIEEVVVLICGHGERDMRCGIMGPLLAEEFSRKFEDAEIRVLDNVSSVGTNEPESSPVSARIGLISHVGGHAFAGNVIISIPKTKQFANHPLAGSRIWYGRVQPKHVEGIIQKTIKEGYIIEELLRWHSPLATNEGDQIS